MAEYEDRNNNEINIEYSGGKVNILEDSAGREIRFFYDGININKIIDPVGREYHYSYDAQYNLKKYYYYGRWGDLPPPGYLAA